MNRILIYCFIIAISLSCKSQKNINQINLIGSSDFISSLIEWRDYYFFDNINPQITSDFTLGEYDYASFDEFQNEYLKDSLHTTNKPIFYLNNKGDLSSLKKELNIISLNERTYYNGEKFFDLLLRELLYHPKYRHPIYKVDIPESYLNFIKIIFEDLKQSLPKTKVYQNIQKSKITISKGKVPLEVRNYDNEVIISPAFARALFLFCSDDFLEDLEDMKQSDQKDWLVDAHESLIYARMRSAFAFFIHHEFAHSYLKNEKEITIENVESICDCHAIYHMKKETEKDLKVKFDSGGRLTTWFILMEKVIELNMQKYWKIHDASNIKNRINLIKNYDIENPKKCIKKIDSMRSILK